MHDADGTQLLLTFQSGQPTEDEQAAFLSRFGSYIWRVARNASDFWNLPDPGEVNDIVQLTHCKLLAPTKKFADCRCTAKQYLVGVVWNAAKEHFRFLHRLPDCDGTGLASQVDRRQEARLRILEDVEAAMQGESATVQKAVEAIYFDNCSLDEAAAQVGIDRFKLMRLRTAFFGRARARLGVA